MRTVLLSCLSLLAATMAQAHPGHLADLAGHDHWVAGAALGAAIALGAWAALKGRRKDQPSQAEADDTPAADPQEA
ncbi:DUF6732 family protein [Fluviibacterium sp. DFM31]|uniref:DUF6732 family protein n=1 Tax=Meridianimarinicoccus marinus TaxID=3231483 RepID=A0ABV3L8N0_9RHOB